MHKIIKNKSILSVPSSPVSSIEEGITISKKLIEILSSFDSSPTENYKRYGLSAPQIGIKKRVCVIAAREGVEPIILINPVIVSRSPTGIVYRESCSSLPGKRVFTVRNTSIKIKADNLQNEIEFGTHKNFSIDEVTNGVHFKDEDLLESIIIQRELDILDGVLITNLKRRYIPQSTPKIKIGRNDKVLIKNKQTGETKRLKFKEATQFIENGWELM